MKTASAEDVKVVILSGMKIRLGKPTTLQLEVREETSAALQEH